MIVSGRFLPEIKVHFKGGGNPSKINLLKIQHNVFDFVTTKDLSNPFMNAQALAEKKLGF